MFYCMHENIQYCVEEAVSEAINSFIAVSYVNFTMIYRRRCLRPSFIYISSPFLYYYDYLRL